MRNFNINDFVQQIKKDKSDCVKNNNLYSNEINKKEKQLELFLNEIESKMKEWNSNG